MENPSAISLGSFGVWKRAHKSSDFDVDARILPGGEEVHHHLLVVLNS